jgi:SAM-dependent methyltransferase
LPGVRERGCRDRRRSDLDAERLEVAKSRFDENAATTGCDIRTHLGPLDTLEEGDFDVIVSENAFEHIMNVAEVLRDIDARLSPSGRVYVGFAPLYHSPFGDHGWERKVLPFRRYFSWPWGHLIFPTSYTLRRLSDLHGRPVDFEDGWPYLTLNRHTPDEFLEMFNSGPLKVVSLVINPSFSLKGRVFGLLARLPFGRKYFVWGMNVILGRKVA